MRRRNKKNCNTTPSGWSSSSSFDIILFPTASLFFHGPSIKWALTFSRTSVVVSLPSRLRVLNLCYHLCLIKNENNGSFFLFWISFYVTCFAFPTLRYVRPSAHPSVFWAAAPKGTKSCRTQGESVCLYFCMSIHPSSPPSSSSGLHLLWGAFWPKFSIIAQIQAIWPNFKILVSEAKILAKKTQIMAQKTLIWPLRPNLASI